MYMLKKKKPNPKTTKQPWDVYKEIKLFRNVKFSQVIVLDLEKYPWCVCPFIRAESLVSTEIESKALCFGELSNTYTLQGK